MVVAGKLQRGCEGEWKCGWKSKENWGKINEGKTLTNPPMQ